MEEREINANESLDIIQNMILKAQKNYSIDSFYYIMWGWLTFSAAMLTYFLTPILREKTGYNLLLISTVYGYLSTQYAFWQNREIHSTYKYYSHVSLRTDGL